MKTLAWKALPCGGVGSRGAARVSRFAVGLCLVAVVAAAGIARGQTPTTWIGATNSTWSGASNWSGGDVPTSSSDATFDLARNTFLNVSGTVNKLIFSNTATVAGSANSNNSSATLQINNGLTHTANNSGNSFMRIQTIALGGSQTWILNGTSGLNSTGANGFTIVPNGTASVPNTFSLNGHTLTKTGSGQVVLGGVTIGDGSFDVSQGSVRFATFGTGSSILTTATGSGTITVRDGAAVIFAVGSNNSRFNVTKQIRMEGSVGVPSTMQTNGSLTFTGTIAAPIEWAGVSNLEHYWVSGGNRRFELTGAWTGTGSVTMLVTSTSAPTTESVVTLSGSNAGFSGIVDNSYSPSGAGVSWVQFGSSNAGSANAEWKLSNANASYRLNGFSLSLGALSGTAGTLSNGGLNAGIGAAIATIGGKGIDTSFSGLITDGSAALSVVKTGAGTLTLGNTNSYSGLTDVQAGRLAYGVSNALGSGSVTVSGGTLDMGSFSDTVGTVTLTGGTIAGTTGVLAASSYDLRSGVVSAILGGSGISLTKSTSGTVALSGVSTYTGATAINAGLLKVDGSIAASSGLSVAAAAWLAGSGTAPAVSGAGLISPGSSPGILTTASIDPSAGMGFGFELTGTGSPNYGSPTSSVNDVLRLTGGTPSLAALTGSNAVSVYFGTTIADGDVFRGGTYVDSATTSGSRTAFESAISGGDWQFFVLGNGGGTHAFNGQNYYTLGEYDPSLTISRSVVADPADFGSGVINGSVTQFVVVPEPNAVALVAMAVVGFAVAGGRLRLRDRQVG